MTKPNGGGTSVWTWAGATLFRGRCLADGGLRDMGRKGQARPPHRLRREPRKDRQPQIHGCGLAGDGRCDEVRHQQRQDRASVFRHGRKLRPCHRKGRDDDGESGVERPE